MDVSITPDGADAYVTNAGSKSVSMINTTTKKVVATAEVGFIPVHVSFSPDGMHAYVTNAGSNSVSVIDTVTKYGEHHCDSWSSPDQRRLFQSILESARSQIIATFR